MSTKSKAYYYLTLPKPPYKSVVHEVMCRVVDVAKKKSMPFVQLVGDQPVYTLIVQLKNENPNKFAKILPFLGPFHAQCSFISAINKRFTGSGISDILVAAGVIAEGSVEKALSGRHYKRSICCLCLMYETLMRRIICSFAVDEFRFSEEIERCIEIVRHPSCYTQETLKHTWDQLEANEEISDFISEAFRKIENTDSSMAKYWLSFMNMVEILMANIHALRIQDWDEFKASLDSCSHGYKSTTTINMVVGWLNFGLK
jgi:hypothetical protein